jgi:hypothetical protein
MNRFTLSRWPHTRKRRGAACLELELLEARNLLDGALANILVNDPALDTTPQDLQNQTAIVLGSGNTVVVAYIDSSPFSADNPSAFGYSVSRNGGASFTHKGTLPPTPPYHSLGDPSLARSSKTGTIFMCTDTSTISPDGVTILADRINLYRSTDNGTTFGGPINATPGFGTGEFSWTRFSNAWLAVDNYPGPGYGNVYLAWDAIQPGEYHVRATRSTDDGLTWEPSGGVSVPPKPGNPQTVTTLASSLTVGPDHTVYVTALTENGAWKSQKIVMSRSTDQGQTFGDPVVVTNLRSNGLLSYLGLTDSNGQVFRNLTLPQAAVNPATGDIYVIYPDKPQTKGDKADIFFTQSIDGGATWSDPVRVNDDATTNDQWQPALAVTPAGSRVGIFWYDRRLDPANNLIDRYGVIGQVSGHTVTFGANFRITDESFPPARGVDPVLPSDYAATGEYDHAVADNNYFYTTWGDSRLADAFHANQADVRFAKIPIGWAGTVSSLAAPAGPDGALAARPVAADSTPFVVPSGAATAAVADPGSLLSREASWSRLAVDAYFIDLARTSQTTAGVTNGDTAPQHTFGLAAPALPGAREPVVPPPARVTDTPTPVLARRASQRPADEWATDVLISGVLCWDGEAGM